MNQNNRNKIPDIFQEKIYRTQAYKHMHSQRLDFPMIVDVEPTNACNLNCLFCARQTMRRPSAMMSFETLKTVVDEMKNYETTSIRFSGWGEPTLNRNIIDFVKYSVDSGVLTHLTTNATRLTPSLSEALLKTGFQKIKFSLQGLTEDEYNRMRPSQSSTDDQAGYQHVANNIQTFVKIRNRLSAQCHIQISVSMLKREQENSTMQQEFFDRWYPLVDSIWGLGNIGIYGGNPLLTSFQRVKDTKRVPNTDLSQGRPLRSHDMNHGKICTELYNKLSVSSEGFIKACCDDYDNRLVVGKVGDDKLKFVWEGQKLKRLRELMEKGDFKSLPAFCQGCDNYL